MTPTTEQLQVLIDVYSDALASDYPYTNQELSRMQTGSVLAKAELSRREVKPELKEWVEQEQDYQHCGGATAYNKQVVDAAALAKLLAVVLSLEDAERIKKATDQPSARATMHAAIEQARGKNGN
jgi:hypothetical protein